MSLGLGDLNKKKKKAKPVAAEKPKAKTEQEGRKSPTGFVRSRTARPWSASNLQKATRNRPRLNTDDFAMNEEWSTLHAEPIFWVDLSQNSKLMKLQDLLAATEDNIQSAVCSSLKAIRTFCFGS